MNYLYMRYIKRILDILFAIIGLVILAPFFLIIAIIIKLDSKGPAIYVHNRVGKNKKIFRLYKFRTMFVDRIPFSAKQKKEFEQNFKLNKDPRITPIGRFLRETSIDELPQLLNVLLGDLSIVGPRPITEKELEKYGANWTKFVSVTPGLTGYWVVNGRSNTSYEKRVELELYYIDNISFKLDLLIFFKTFKCVLKKDGAF